MLPTKCPQLNEAKHQEMWPGRDELREIGMRIKQTLASVAVSQGMIPASAAVAEDTCM